MSWNAAVAFRRSASEDWPAAATGATTAIDRAAVTAAARISRRISHLDRDFVDLGRRVAGALVDAHDGFPRGTGREAEDLARHRVEPRPLVVHGLIAFEREIAAMGLGQLLRGHAEEAVVDVHERRHRCPPYRPAQRRPSTEGSAIRCRTPSVDRPIGRSEDDLIRREVGGP